MWFDGEMTSAYQNGIKLAIEDCGYEPKKIDAEEYLGDVIDKIMAEIRESRFVVADLTGNRNGVYFEAGFAAGLEIPVVWTCRKDWKEQIHFDATHFNRIQWETPQELCERLKTRIIATIGRGPLNPVNER